MGVLATKRCTFQPPLKDKGLRIKDRYGPPCGRAMESTTTKNGIKWFWCDIHDRREEGPVWGV